MSNPDQAEPNDPRGQPTGGDITLSLTSSAPEMPPPEVPDPPATGDPHVDAALGRLHANMSTGDLDAQADAGEAMRRVLQDRLADLGGD